MAIKQEVKQEDEEYDIQGADDAACAVAPVKRERYEEEEEETAPKDEGDAPPSSPPCCAEGKGMQSTAGGSQGFVQPCLPFLLGCTILWT